MADSLSFALSIVKKAYTETNWAKNDLDANLGDHIIDILESQLVFSHIPKVAALAQELSDVISSFE